MALNNAKPLHSNDTVIINFGHRIYCFHFPLSHCVPRSYDTRGNHAGTPSHWKDEEILENRAIFRTVRSPAELVIKPVKV